jgi:adenylate cyclase
MFFRIGISQGEVMAEEGAIYGNEVNVAARLEGLADPGGVCISSIVNTNIEGKTNFPIEYLGEHELKNISRLVPVYRLNILQGSGESTRANPTVSHRTKPSIAVLPFSNFAAEADQDYFADSNPCW